MKKVILMLFVAVNLNAQTKSYFLTEWGISTNYEKQTLSPAFTVGASVLNLIGGEESNNGFRLDLGLKLIDLKFGSSLKIGYQYQNVYGYGFFQLIKNGLNPAYAGLGASYIVLQNTDIIEIGYEQPIEKYGNNYLGTFKLSVRVPFR